MEECPIMKALGKLIGVVRVLLVPKWRCSLREVGHQESMPVVNNGIMIVTAGAPTLTQR
jgi:hypothetical protein